MPSKSDDDFLVDESPDDFSLEEDGEEFELESEKDSDDEAEHEGVEFDEDDFEIPTKKANSTKRKAPSKIKDKPKPKSKNENKENIKAPVKQAKTTKKTETTKKSTRTDTKSSKNTGNDAEKVAKYLENTNRPYSVINVFDNLHKTIPKPSLARLLDSLTTEGVISSKAYGKTKIYYYNQDNMEVASKDELDSMDSRIEALKDEINSVNAEIKTKESELNMINSSLTDEQLDESLKSIQEELEQLRNKLGEVEKEDRIPISPERKNKLFASFKRYRDGWIKRRRIVIDAVDQIADGLEKKPKVVYEICGIETDKEANETLPDLPKL